MIVAICEEFTAGDPALTECIRNAATGGGMMPWIVVVPVGLMVAGTVAMYFRQAKGRRDGNPAVAQVFLREFLLLLGGLQLLMAAGFGLAVTRGGGIGFVIPLVVMSVIGLSMVVIALKVGRTQSS